MVIRTTHEYYSQARSQDFVQEGANLARAQDTPTKNRKLLGFGPVFFGSRPIIFFSQFNYKILFYFSVQGGGMAHLAPIGYVPDYSRCVCIFMLGDI